MKTVKAFLLLIILISGSVFSEENFVPSELPLEEAVPEVGASAPTSAPTVGRRVLLVTSQPNRSREESGWRPMGPITTAIIKAAVVSAGFRPVEWQASGQGSWPSMVALLRALEDANRRTEESIKTLILVRWDSISLAHKEREIGRRDYGRGDFFGEDYFYWDSDNPLVERILPREVRGIARDLLRSVNTARSEQVFLDRITVEVKALEDGLLTDVSEPITFEGLVTDSLSAFQLRGVIRKVKVASANAGAVAFTKAAAEELVKSLGRIKKEK